MSVADARLELEAEGFQLDRVIGTSAPPAHPDLPSRALNPDRPARSRLARILFFSPEQDHNRMPRALTSSDARRRDRCCDRVRFDLEYHGRRPVAGEVPAQCEQQHAEFHGDGRSGRDRRPGCPRVRMDGSCPGELGGADAANRRTGRLHPEVQRAGEPVGASAPRHGERRGPDRRGRPGGRIVPVQPRSRPGTDRRGRHLDRRQRPGSDRLLVDDGERSGLDRRDRRAHKGAAPAVSPCGRSQTRARCGSAP